MADPPQFIRFRAAIGALGGPPSSKRLDEVDWWDHPLSGGERRRLAFARVLPTKPATVFLDEQGEDESRECPPARA